MDAPKFQNGRDQVVTISEAARVLGVANRTIHLWIERGILKSWKTPGGHWRIPRENVQAILKDRERQLAAQGKNDVCRVLVVEDDPDAIDYYQDAFSGWDLPIHLNTAENGFQGLIQIGEDHPDLIITDLKMPGMDGFEFVRNLQSRTNLKHTRVIAVTALKEKEVVERGGLPDDVPIFFKPVSLDRIREIIKDVLLSKRPGRGY
ncbi:MAG: response regulator [Magnetococcales bacterium]|nr:response regulator [Magnetococcales bacterium]